MSAQPIIPDYPGLWPIFDDFKAIVNKLFNTRTRSLVDLCEQKGASRAEIARALKYNQSLITHYFPKKYEKVVES